jgi:excisionase family DNA binding protein
MNEIMTVQEVADLLQVSVQTVRSMTATNQLPSYKIGVLIRYNRNQIMKMFGGTEEKDPVIEWLYQQIKNRKEEIKK